jgi:hypothetical protein
MKVSEQKEIMEPKCTEAKLKEIISFKSRSKATNYKNKCLSISHLAIKSPAMKIKT